MSDPAKVVTTLRCKVAVCGASGVGKTALINNLLSSGKDFSKAYKVTSGVEVIVCSLRLPHAPVVVELYLFDTSGNPLYWDLIPQYWNGITSAVLVYDVTNPATLEDCTKWYSLLMKLRRDKQEKLRCVVVGNKFDMGGSQTTAKAEELVQSWAEDEDIPIFQASAVPPGMDVQDPFMHIATEFHQFYESKLHDIYPLLA